ncbi:hypothetical protein K469DRAFT_612456 [Zopfia rhizophila CBS 207.26]|uniref:Uncharacterized protein n=1 Tax=Zopfia rhizophila CBS 207.26 TaxID=1314779 RepID=A0A6A6DBG3_9PEZI|nr:hypothetical protein K469DRAFT_612456 [Zopfia rhizophila CBS 207.26]
MTMSFLFGLLGALAQHVLYKSLHHTAPEGEEKVRLVLYGRALAYFCKVTFGGCVILCYRQRIWKTFRERALSVWAIDQLFLATEDVSLFLNWETLSKATMATSMALVIWLIPIATIIFSPGALTWGQFLDRDSSNIPVPTINFTSESYKDFRVPIKLPDGRTRRSLLFYNTTDLQAKTPGWFDYYDKPSADLTRVSLMAAYSLKNQSLNLEDARYESCGGDYNCTYTLSFVGPGYKCDYQAEGVGDDGKLAGAPFNTSWLAPVGSLAYVAEVDLGEYIRPQVNTTRGQADVITDDLGVFKTEPVLWLGYSVNTTEPLPKDSPFSEHWTHKYEPHIFSCVHYETKYTVQFNYSGPFFSTNIIHDFLHPIINTTLSRSPDGLLVPEPASNFISPRTDVHLYKKIAAYHAMGQALRTFLRGKIELEPPIPGPSFPRTYSEITTTRLVDKASTPLFNLSAEVQSFYADMMLSLLSNPQMLVVDRDNVEVNTTRYKQAFIYNAGKLWACYIPVIFFVFVFLVIGAWAIYQDGTTFSVGFSRIMVTTRNSTLDEISRGACLGNDPFPNELMNTRLRFGVLNDDVDEFGTPALAYGYGDERGGLQHCAFGVPSEVTEIKRGVPYAGLRGRKEWSVVKEKMD